jgi:hypothetical protein
MGGARDTIFREFGKKNFVVNNVKSFFKTQENTNCMYSAPSLKIQKYDLRHAANCVQLTYFLGNHTGVHKGDR